MAGFPSRNSLYSPDQIYRRSDDEPFGDRSLVVATDDQWRYVPVRRLVLFIERSIDAALQRAAFEPNGSALWGRVTREIDDFLSALFQRGELKGDDPSDAFSSNAGSRP
jgi:phage tail sheath protein FI